MVRVRTFHLDDQGEIQLAETDLTFDGRKIRKVLRVEFYFQDNPEPSHVFECRPRDASYLERSGNKLGSLDLQSYFRASPYSLALSLDGGSLHVGGKPAIAAPKLASSSEWPTPGGTDWLVGAQLLLAAIAVPGTATNTPDDGPWIHGRHATIRNAAGALHRIVTPAISARYRVEGQSSAREYSMRVNAWTIETIRFAGKDFTYQERLHPAAATAATLAHVRAARHRRRRLLLVAPFDGNTIARLWNGDAATRLRDYVASVRAGRGLSLVGDLNATDTNARFALGFDVDGEENWGVSSGVTVVGHRLTCIRSCLNNQDDPPTESRPFEVFLRSLSDYRGAPPTIEVELAQPKLAGTSTPGLVEAPALETDLPEWQAAFTVAKAAGASSASTNPVRVGSLDIWFAKALPAVPTDPASYTIDFARGLSCWLRGKLARSTVPEVEASITATRLPLLDVRPGACDPLPDEWRAERTTRGIEGSYATSADETALAKRLRRPVPIVIELGSAAPSSEVRAVLLGWERLAPSRDRSLKLEIERLPKSHKGAKKASGTSETYRVAVLDIAPFTVMCVQGPALWSVTEHREIANWSTSELEGEKWEIVGGLRGFRFSLPPQTVGEAMVRGPGWSIPAGSAMDYRFGTSSIVDANASYFAQHFAEAPWNIRRVMGYPGQRAPGVSVSRLRVELLYGMTASIDAARVPYAIRLAEIGARLGAWASPISFVAVDALLEKNVPTARSAALAQHRADFVADLAVLNRRPAVFELYGAGESLLAPGPGEQRRSTGDLTLEHGLTFFLRGELSDSAYGPPCDWTYPIPVPRRKEAKPPDGFNNGTLQGGAVFGFESDHILREVWKNRTAPRGRIGRLMLSTLGGYGEQRAVFANGKTIIYSDTEAGRVSYYAVERIGRVGVLWNRARHVIVYRRSVLPSAQFDSEQPEDHDGRPILRKYEEFVELLEPDRRYPERGDAVRDAGFVLAARFGSTRIPVNGAWSRDLEHGWEIPLWQESADPEIYPKPVIKLQVAGAAAEAPFDAVLSEPQRLYFYTSTRPEDTDNTDAWTPVTRVDFPLSALPTEDVVTGLPPKIAFSNAQGIKVRAEVKLPSVCDVPLGWERQSFRVLTTARPANLVAGRESARLSAKLTVVTMQRGRQTPQPAAASGIEVAALRGLRARQMAVDNIASALRAEPLPSSAAQKPEFTARVNALLDRLKQSEDAAAPARSGVRDGLVELDRLFGSAGGACAQVRQLGLASVATYSRTCIQALFDKRDEILEIAESLAALPSKDAIKAQLRDHTEAPLRDALSTLSRVRSPFGGLDQAVLQLRELLFQHGQRASNEFEQLEKDLLAQSPGALTRWRTLAASWMTGLHALEAHIPTETSTPLGDFAADTAAFLRAITTAIGNATVAIEAALATNDHAALVLALNDARSYVFDVGLFALCERLSTIRLELDAYIEAIVDQPLSNAGARLGELASAATDALTAAIDALPSAPDASAIRDAVATVFKEIAEAVSGAFELASERAVEPLERLCGDFKNEVLGLLESKFGNLVSGASTLITALRKAADGEVESWRGFLEDELQKYVPMYRDLVDGADEVLRRLGRVPAFNDPDATLRLVRAVGEGPLLPGLEFNADRIAYLFDDVENAIRTSPVAALVNEVGSTLEALGVRLPLRELRDRLIADPLKDFDIPRILEDFAGLKRLFQKLKMPDLSEHGIRITHGFDKEKQSAWLRADLDISLPKRAPIFEFGPLELSLDSSKAVAFTDVRGGVDQAPVFSKAAYVTGDWSLRVGGTPLIAFIQTKLEMKDGSGLSFDVRPENIRLDRVVAWLNDVVKSFSDPDSGLALELIGADEGGLEGLRVMLDLPVPPIGSGAVALSGLRIGARFELLVNDEGKGFAIGIGLNFGKKTEPFTLVIAFLGGGGWLDAYAKYRPDHGEFDIAVTVGMVAAAGAAFAVPAVHGSVFVHIGIYAEYHVKGTSGGGLSLALMFLLTGRAVVCGIATVDLALLLQLIYGADRSLVGTGHLSIRIRISRFFKISVSRSVRYKLAGGGGGNAFMDLSQPPSDAKRAIDLAVLELSFIEDYLP